MSDHYTKPEDVITGEVILAAHINALGTNSLAGFDSLETEVDAIIPTVSTLRDEVAADLVLTNADVVLTHADVVLTGLDVAATNADVVLTGLDAAATAADLVATNQDTIDTAADLVATNQDTIDTAADVVSTGIDAALSKQYAVAIPSEPVELSSKTWAIAPDLVSNPSGSAKYWADRASAEGITAVSPGTGISIDDITDPKVPVITNSLPNVAGNLGNTPAATTVTVTSTNGTSTVLPAATTSLAGVLTGADKTKLDGIATSANNYVHPTTHPPSIIAETTSDRFVSDTQINSWTAKLDDVDAGSGISIDKTTPLTPVISLANPNLLVNATFLIGVNGGVRSIGQFIGTRWEVTAAGTFTSNTTSPYTFNPTNTFSAGLVVKQEGATITDYWTLDAPVVVSITYGNIWVYGHEVVAGTPWVTTATNLGLSVVSLGHASNTSIFRGLKVEYGTEATPLIGQWVDPVTERLRANSTY